MRNIQWIWVMLLALTVACNTPKGSQSANDKDKETEVSSSAKAKTPVEKTISIKGTVLNPQGGDIYFFKYSNTSEKIYLDTVKSNSDGSFELSVTLDQPAFFGINFYNKQEQVLILNDSDVTIKADGKAEGLFEVTGSRDTDLFNKYQKQTQAANEKSQGLRQRYSTADAAGKKQIQEEFKVFVAETTEKTKAFIGEAEGSIVAILAAQMLDADENIDFVSKLADNMVKEYPNSEIALQYQKEINSVRKTAIGQPAPDIELETPTGNKISLSSLKGKYVLIDFWASWCGPCRKENPNVVKLYKKYKGKDFEILGVSLDKNKEAWEAAIAKDGLDWLHISDLKMWQSSVVPLYNVTGIPLTVLVDKKGVIIAKNLRGEELGDKLKELL